MSQRRVQIKFRPSRDPDEEYVDVVFYGVPGVRPELQSGVMFEPEGDAWQLSFFTAQHFATQEEAEQWLARMRGDGITLLDDDDNEIDSSDDLVQRDGGWSLESGFCVKPVPGLEAGQQWVSEHLDFILETATITGMNSHSYG
jgi:hypothetical protein